MSQVATSTEPGWRPDPSGRYEWRYWDGGWTNRVANSAPAGTAGPAATSAPAAPAAPPAPATPPPAPTTTGEPPAAPVTTTAEVPAAPVTTSAAPVAEPVPVPRPSRDTVARAPFGTETEPTPAPAPAPPVRRRRTPWAFIVDFFHSFADEPESYHSGLAREPLPADPRGERMVNAPGNYGHAGITALAACGIVAGAYLPWLSGTIGIANFQRSGFDQGMGVAYSIGAAALAISALLSVRMRVLRWLTIILSFVLAGFVVRDLLDTYDTMQKMNQIRSISANVGWGLWMMIISAAIAMIAAVRLSEDQKID
jgi:hypothetical protein